VCVFVHVCVCVCVCAYVCVSMCVCARVSMGVLNGRLNMVQQWSKDISCFSGSVFLRDNRPSARCGLWSMIFQYLYVNANQR
jgi:hypothetical protein